MLYTLLEYMYFPKRSEPFQVSLRIFIADTKKCIFFYFRPSCALTYEIDEH
jgi:hypothetical protein